MIHYACEIVIPPTDNIEKSIEEVMRPFSENNEGDDRDRNAFWYFYVIGGRFSGKKVLARFDKEKMDAFHDELSKRKVTVSSLQCGGR